MKRVALQHFGRSQVASLSDTLWWDFVEKHSKVKISHALRLYATAILYNPQHSSQEEQKQRLKTIAKLWIQTHQRHTQ
jgi:hypothetical protein